MALAPQHTFQVLTKRSTRMREYMAVNPGFRIRTAMQAIRRQPVIEMDWPLPNVWLGVSVENQKRADERIPDLLATPAAVRWISAEPLLGRMNLRRIRIAPDHHTIIDSLDGYALSDNWSGSGHERTKLDWVVVGGESGPGARPMHPDWAHSLRDQCAAAGVAFHFKQWGEWAPTDGDDPDWFKHSDRDAIHRFEPRGGPYAAKVGKARAGRLLDGVNHDGWPQVRHG
jgi:protein gp37